MAKENFVGIDVSKQYLDTYSTGTSSHCQYENTDEGLKKLVVALEKAPPMLVLFESTGNYELELMIVLTEKKIPF